jgi:NADPH:quinone reductase
MKAVVLKEFGGPENLSLGDLPIPSVEPGTVLIRAVAASVNPADISISKGTPFSPVLPAVLGCDVAGVIESVGDGVTGLAGFLQVHHGSDSWRCFRRHSPKVAMGC